MEPLPTDVAGLRAHIAHLQEELNSLRSRYDTLQEAHTRAAERYKADFKKWRDFKRWMFHDAETDDHVKSALKRGDFVQCTKASVLGKRKLMEDFGFDLHSEDDHDHKQESIKVDIPHSPRHQRRKSYHGESSVKHLSSSPDIGKDPFLVSTNGDDKSSVSNHQNETPCKAESSRPISVTEPRKGRGRYAQVPSTMNTINARFSIRREKNDGVDFQFDAVVRSRQERKHMLGSDCECCREYYEAVGPLPPSRQPLWRTPTKCKPPHNLHAPVNDKENTDDAEEHKRLISRHRHHWHRAKTPPGYWDIGFPDTQEVLDINQRAAEMHRRKLVEVESEAKNNGRYIERVHHQ